MKPIATTLAVSTILLVSASLAHAATLSGTHCERLTALTIPNVSVLHATQVAAGTFTVPSSPRALETPAFCRVEIEAHPTPDSNIRIEVWMPSHEAWNGKFQGVGNGGYQGNINYQAMSTALKQGYAVAATDTGHTGDDLAFGEGHPDKVTDWAYRSIHVTAEIGKLVVRNHLGRAPVHSYFVGCSTGGHQALSEAQRFPEDYDGIVAGDPAYDRVHQTAAYLWSWKATHDNSGVSLLSPASLKLVTQSAIAACDAADGVKDGIIADPRRCKFDLNTLACKAGATDDSCLTPQQIEALRKVYAGTSNPRTHEQIFPGWSFGSESFGAAAGQGWGAYILDPKQPMRIDVFRYFLFNDPSWDWHTFDFDRDMAFADAKIGEMAAVNPDLSAFRARGGKLLMYTGWADPVAAPLDILKYYTAATARNGGTERTKEFFRFFMVPGMGHCGGGLGPNTFDALSSLDTWVEQAKPPTRILASHITDGKVDRIRPLCAFPQEAVWKGSGSTDDQANFTCTQRP
jgi:feruloyl esterase